MKEDFVISIVGRQQSDEDDGEINIETVGSYVYKDGARFITYKEYDEDDPNRSQTSILKVEGNRKVTLMRTGSATRLILEKGQRHLCQYDTGFGSLMVGVFTNTVKTSLDDNGGSLHIDYTLDINASLSSHNSIQVDIRPAGETLSV